MGEAARARHEPTHPGRIARLDDIQSLVVGEAAVVTLLALVEGPTEGDLPQRREQLFGLSSPAGHALAALAKQDFPRGVLLPMG